MDKTKEKEKFVIEAPLIIMYKQQGYIIARLYPSETDSYESYGLMICDLIRYVADYFNVSEDDVFEWVEKEHYHHTMDFAKPD